MSAIDPRDQRIAELEALVTKLLARIEAQDKRIAEQDVKIAELEARLRQNSRNSSKPPSSDPPETPGRKSDPTGRKPGGQPGHQGSKRDLVPPEKVDDFVSVQAKRCSRCNSALEQRSGTPPARRHQVFELPKVTPHVTEYQLEFAYCPCCKDWSPASLPAGVPQSSFGPRLTAFVALCTGRFRLSKRQTKDLLADAFGLDIALGSISNLEQTVSAALATTVEEARAFVREQPVVHQDETGWWEARIRAWLWVATTSLVAVFTIIRSRGKEVAKQMLGERFSGTLVSDRWCAYNWVDVLKRQVCWSHLIREFEGFLDRGGDAKRIGELLLAEMFVMFEWWHKARDGTLLPATFQKKMRPLMREVERLLEEGALCPNAKVAGTCAEILKLRDALWTFVYVKGVDPTNNMAERDLRHAVIWRKCSYGTSSSAGSRFVERILTAAMTLRKQERNVLEFLTTACEALLVGAPGPSLLPVQAAHLTSAAA